MRIINFLIVPLAVCLLSAAACKQDANQNRPKTTTTNQNVNTNIATNTANNNSSQTAAIPIYTYEVVNTYKHDSSAFTEGLFFRDGFLFESVGREGKSDLRKVKFETGEVVQRRKLDQQYFAEGIAEINNKIYQLTYTSGLCFVYDSNTFEPITQFGYNFGEGWGMTTDGTNLIVSDGTHQIRFLDPNTFRVVRTINVFNSFNNHPLFNINELEFIKGEIWANVWHSEEPDVLGKPNYIVRINPQDGKVLGWIDLGGISPDDVARDNENTLNGIAYDAATDRIFVTGKQWKKLFEIKIKPKNG